MVDLIAQLAEFPTATIYEAYQSRGAMDQSIKPLFPGMHIVGEALTLRCAPFDNMAIHRALARNIRGKVLVIGTETDDGLHGTYCGGIIAKAARYQGALGIVLDGFVRDAQEIGQIGLPIFCRGIALASSKKNSPGELENSVACAGVPVNPGDFVFGDADGVVVVNKAEAKAVLRAARERQKFEQYMIEGVLSGKTTIELLGLSEFDGQS